MPRKVTLNSKILYSTAAKLALFIILKLFLSAFLNFGEGRAFTLYETYNTTIMKKLFTFIALFIIAVQGVSLAACSDDHEEPVMADQLPQAAKTFLATYYPSVNIMSSVKDKNDYDVILANGHSVDFNKAGEWKEVDAPHGQTVPSGFYPATIDAYVADLTGQGGINEISRVSGGYKVELVSGTDLKFNAEGALTKIIYD